MKPIWIASLLTLAAALLFGQGQSSSLTIHVVASGKSGLIRNLSSKDFKVSVDGKDRAVAAAAIPPAGKHAVVLLFDNTTMNVQDQGNVRGYVADFLNSSANPNLYIEIATFRTGIEVVQRYTTDAARLKAALVNTASSAVANTVGGAAGALTGTNLGGRETGQTSLGNAAASGDQTMKTQAFAESLRGLLDSMAPIRGRKAVLLFSGGQSFSADASPQVDAAIEAGNRAGVTIYGISDNTSFARTFADPTGGSTVKVTQYLARTLQQIVQELDAYYDVTVDVSDPGLAGECHALKVKVNTEGVDVRAPTSFCPAARRDSLAGTATGKNLDAWLAGGRKGSLTPSVQAFWRYEGEAPQATVIVALEAPLAGIAFRKVKNKFHGELSVAGAAYRTDGVESARFSESIALDFNDKKEADAFTKRPYHYENLLQLSAGTYTLKAAISPAADTWGRAETSLEIPRRDASKLDMSGVVLSRELRPAPDVSSGLAPEMIEGATPLVAGGRQVVPAGQTRFKKSERLYLYTEIYEPSLAGTNTAEVSFQYRIVDRASGDVRAASGPPASVVSFVRAGNPVIPVATSAAISQLAPGKYRLEVRALRANGSADVVRSADFKIVE